MAGTVVIFDFDRTIIDDDSDRWVVTEMGLTILFRELLGTMPWNSLMDRMMMELHSNGKTTNEIAECLGRAPLHPRIIAAIKSAHALGCDLKVVSDANQFFIETILKHHGILGCFSEIISNPTVVDEEGRLKIFPYHDFTSSPHGCNLCPFNMCKIDNNKNIESPVKKKPEAIFTFFGEYQRHLHLQSLTSEDIETISTFVAILASSRLKPSLISIRTTSKSSFSRFFFWQQILTVVTMSLRKPPLPRILLNNVSCMRNAQQILRHVNVSVHDGGALILTGTNGSGKSTFLRMMAGFSKPSAGEILWNGHNITESGVFHQYKLQLNWLSLKDAIKEKFTVLDNVQWFELLEGKYGKSLPALELMGLGRLAKDKARLLSMGQRKRVQLARLLAMDRQIWLLDEPSVALDDEGVRLLEYIIAEHRKKGGIVFVATHLPIKIEDAMYLRLPPRFPRRMTLVDMLDRGD